ncbi:hypothetical protein H6P81_016653 [Aristolochia fimbriata]|uniref:Uncharacterized protein n=1 Tax=Aristolochia fimbriata TaxID=158543 RepID=A0AAV7E917_ARIFI|nr:hypothetical protein H6P81_016653 [Aristolochia fimbriata]
MSISTNDFSHENADTDSDTMSDVPADYQQISVSDDDTDGGNSRNGYPVGVNGDDPHFDVDLVPVAGESLDPPSLQNPNFYSYSDGVRHAENGIHLLHVHDDGEVDERETDEEEKGSEVSESATLTAFREDESRRNAPLTPENASRIMDAMRGVVFHGGAPDWVNQVSEEQWVNRLRVLRGETSSGN